MSSHIDEERIGQALQALRDADAGVDGGADAEARAVLAFRRQQRRRGFERLAVAAVMAVTGIAAVWSYAIHQTPPKATAVAQISPADSREVLTPFFPLMPSSPQLENGVIIRVTVPASVMQRVGLPVVAAHLSDLVQAEVLVGQDDLARAIRFVTYAQKD